MDVLFERFYVFLPVLARMSGFLAASPLLGGKGVPLQIKIGMSVYLAMVVTPALAPVAMPQDILPWVALIVRELIVGLSIGFIVNILMSALHVAGQFMDVPIGFGMVNVFDARLGLSVPIIAQFYYLIAVLIFFTINAHHYLISAVVASYGVVGLGAGVLGPEVAQSVLEFFSQMFIIGFKIALPVIATLFLSDVALGIVARAVPQINVFVIGFPIKIGVGLLVVTLGLPFYVRILKSLFSGDELLKWVQQVLVAFSS